MRLSERLCFPLPDSLMSDLRRNYIFVPGALSWMCAFVLLSAVFSRAQNVVINELMYHPASHLASEEYIELHNRGTTNVSLAGWALTGGVDFVFPSNAVINASSYLVVAAQRPTFVAKYP